MAELWYGHFDSTPEDPRPLLASEWAKYIESFITNGIRNGGTTLQVTQNQGMTVKVDTGIANIRGYIMQLREDFSGRYYQVVVPAAHPQYPRIDRLVLRLDRRIATRNIKPMISMGVASANPVPPPLVRTDTELYELSLAQIRVNANAVTITQSNITDERFNTDLCGIMNSVLGLDPSVWQAQFEAFLKSVKDTADNDWNKFWDNFLLEQVVLWEHELQRQKNTWEAWFATIKVDLQTYVTFNFDNLAAFGGTNYEYSNPEVSPVTETLTIAASGVVVARRVTTYSGNDINTGMGTIVETVYQSNGLTILRTSTMSFNLTTRKVSVV